MLRRLLLLFLIGGSAQGMGAAVTDVPKTSNKLRWSTPTIKVFISSSLMNSSAAIKHDGDVNDAVLRALQTWESAANIEFQIAVSDLTAISPPGPVGDGVSLITIAPEVENVLAFSRKPQTSSALTRVFYDLRGFITEADIALNPSHLFTADKTPGTFDLEAVLTHEIGHLLGLSHSADASAIMFDGVPRNSIYGTTHTIQSLSADDRAKVRGAYGTTEVVDGCCAKIRARLNVTAEPSGEYLVWIQDATTGALVEVNVSGHNKLTKFESLTRGNYQLLTQNKPKGNLSFAAFHASVRENQLDGTTVIGGIAAPTTFDIQFISAGGELSKRGVKLEPGNSYKLIISGPGVSSPDLQFGTTSKRIHVEPIRFENLTAASGFPQRVLQVSVSASVLAGQYSLFAEDRHGSRRYLVGAIAVA